MSNNAQSIAINNAWHNRLPQWIRNDPEYSRLRQGCRHTLQVMANRCDKPQEGSETLLVCLGGTSLIATCGCCAATFWGHLKKLLELGYVVPLTNGGGHLASAYGIPSQRDELDEFKAKRGDKARRWNREDTQEILSLVSKNQTLAIDKPLVSKNHTLATGAPLVSKNWTAAVQKLDGSRPEIKRQPSKNWTLPSLLPSSYTHTCKPSSENENQVLNSLHDDDQGKEKRLFDKVNLPDSATSDEIKSALFRAGVDPGRAHKLANNSLTTPEMVRDVLGRADGYMKSNPGGYIGSMIEDALGKARQQLKEERDSQFELAQRMLSEAKESIDGLSDDELQEAVDSISALKGLRLEDARRDPVFRKEIASWLIKQQDEEKEGAA